jgi:ubiquinone/menaquinone biosynthesis C-methylase UbiE
MLTLNGFIHWLKWKKALPEELGFWDEWLTTKGGEWPEDYVRRLDAEGELQENLKEYLSEVPDGGEISILDVGSGPITRLGYRWGARKVKMTAVDALADDYNALLKRHGITPALRTLACSAERLTRLFPENHFDFAYCRNALDHCHDPMGAIRQMIRVTRPGGLAVLEHYANEAEQTSYDGLHQWNFDLCDGRLTLWNRDTRIDVADSVKDLATSRWEKKRIGREWVIAVMRKHAH